MRTSIRRISLALACVVVATATAAANGRAPITNGIHFKPGDPHSVYVATTFGFLISHDDGCTFHWVCEQNVGYGGTFDPKYAIATDGTIFATTFTGLRVSRDGGCSFTTATAEEPADDPGRIADTWIDALDIGPSGEVWVATAESGRPNNIYVSTDNGVTFEPKNMQSSTVWWKSVKVAPTDGQRVYASGYEVAGNAVAHFFRSDNAGGTWTESPLAGVQYGSMPIVLAAAVGRANRDLVFMISLEANPPMGDRLYRSIDGGQTFTEVLSTTQPIRDVVLRDDTRVLVAAGSSGSFESTNGGAAFTPMASPPQLTCAGQDPSGQLVGCGANWQPDFFAVGRSQDGGAWQKLLRFVELAGPLDCPAGTAEHDVCDVQQWTAMKDQFGIKGEGGCNAVSDGAVDGPVETKSGGCCDASSGSPVAAFWLFALVGWTMRRRRPRGEELSVTIGGPTNSGALRG